MSVYAVDKLIAETRRLAAEYRRATGNTLPVTAELATHDAIRLLDLHQAGEDQPGIDALMRSGEQELRVLIKGRAIFDERKGGQRIGQLRMDLPWDALLLVLMDENYDTTEIYRLDRADYEDLQDEVDNSRRSKRGAMSVARFRIVGQRIWNREQGREDDGYWDNRAEA